MDTLSQHQKNKLSLGSVSDRVNGFGLKYFYADSNNINELDFQTKIAIGAARTGNCPVMLHVKTYRLNSHSKGDDIGQKSKEIKNLKKIC